MIDQIFAVIFHKDGRADDTALELLAAARRINHNALVTAIVAGSGDNLQAVCDQMAKVYTAVWKLESEALGYPNAEVIRKALVALLPSNVMVLVAHDALGMDLAPGLSVKIDAAFISDVVGIDGINADQLSIVRQEFGGQVNAHVTADIAAGVVMTIRPGIFQPEERTLVNGDIVDRSDEMGDLAVARQFLEIVAAEAGDVDISKSDVLVSVGRGIEDADNLEVAFDLATVMGADVSCSRPIVDAKWMEKSRQVGTSGRTVRPKVYLALGISGSFQHLGGLKGNPFVVAINKNPKAPIFQVADVGIEADILDFVPELTEKLEAL